MGMIYAKNKKDAVKKGKAYIRNVMQESDNRYDIIVGRKSSQYDYDNNMAFDVQLRKKRKYII